MSNEDRLAILSREVSRQKGQLNMLVEQVNGLKKDNSMIGLRFEQIEKSATDFYENVRSQLVELFSSVESARETLDDISGRIEDIEDEEDNDLVEPDQTIPGDDVEFDPNLLDFTGTGNSEPEDDADVASDRRWEQEREEEREEEEEDDDYDYTDVAGQPHAKNEWV